MHDLWRIARNCSGALTLALLLATPLAHADVNDFVITRFDADYSLSRHDPQGELHIIEHIKVQFNDNNHGILRAIPDSYKHHSLQIHINSVSSPSGASSEYTTYGSNSNTVLKIGDPDRTVTGDQEYIIDYTLRNVMSFYNDHDELYWDVNGDQWSQQFRDVALTLHVPADVRLSSQAPMCYTGGFGSLAHDCIVTHSPTEITVRTTSVLEPNETLSVVAGFDKGYFSPSQWYETLGEHTRGLVAFFVPFLLLAGTAGAFWFKRGRDAKGRGTIVPQYDAPDDLKPIEVGTLADFKTDNRDITATIIDLAIRGYIKIIEQKQVRKLRRDTTTYTLRLQPGGVKGLTSDEALLLEKLFGNLTRGKEVDIATLKYKLASTATELRKSVSSSLAERDYFRTKPLSVMPGFFKFFSFTLWFAIIIFAFVQHPGWGVAGTVAGALVAGIFIYFWPSRTAKGVAAKEHILGLKLYLETAEAERLKMLQSPNAPYAKNAGEPKKTVKLFEKLLPYAMVLGVEQQWAKQFENIYRTPPDWYEGNWRTFNAVYLASALSGGISPAVNSAFASPNSPSGSGFSGGGAAGGGGGGGGGGW